MRSLVILVALAAGLGAQTDAHPSLTPERLRADLSFLASDDMRGRDTPSPELDRAADWLGKEFARAGLRPAFGESFFQGRARGDRARAKGALVVAGERFPVTPRHVTGAGAGATALTDVPLLVWKGGWRRVDPKREQAVKGRVVVIAGPEPREGSPRFLFRLRRRAAMLAREGARAVLVSSAAPLDPLSSSDVAVLWSDAAVLAEAVKGSGGRVREAVLDLELPAHEKALARNVGAVIEGSDPELKKDLIVFSAHYDHVGVGRAVGGDDIYNGADDDGTGTVAVLAIARALAALPRAPKRTCLFLCFYGEEKGMLGSSFYVGNAPFPLTAHKAVFNLEMLGRPDDIPKRSAWVTGWRLSDFGPLIAGPGKAAGITFYEHKRRSRFLFAASDNISFARVGIPAHSISAGSLHEDYHQPSDQVEKIDFANMCDVVRGIVHAGRAMADGGTLPDWKADERAAASYRAARERLRKK